MLEEQQPSGQRPEGHSPSKHHGGLRSYFREVANLPGRLLLHTFCMTHVLTAGRSMCVLRMSFSTSFHRPSTTSRSGTQLSTSLEADVPRPAAEAVYRRRIRPRAL